MNNQTNKNAMRGFRITSFSFVNIQGLSGNHSLTRLFFRGPDLFDSREVLHLLPVLNGGEDE